MEERAENIRRRRAGKSSAYIDYTMLFCVFLLNIIGLLMIYSTTAYKSGSEDFMSQLIAVCLGIGLMVVLFIFGFKWIPSDKLVFIAFCMAIGSIVLLLIPGIKVTLNGATRWFKFFGLMTVQSAEIVKIAIIMIMAYILSKYDMLRNWKGILIALAIPGSIAITLGLISNNMSSAIIICGIAGIMIFVNSRRYRPYIIGGIAVAIIVVILVILISRGSGGGFRGGRIRVWINPEDAALKDLGVDNYQTIQALYAIGSGGIWGKGIGEGIQKMNKIPEAENDMIFAVLCEELGLVGALVVIVLFAVLIFRLIRLAQNCNSVYDSLIVSGVAGHIALQSVLNIAVVTNTIPNTGVSLPFISSGGSSVLCLLFEIGLVLSITKNQRAR